MAVTRSPPRLRQEPLGIVVLINCQAELLEIVLEIVGAMRPPGRFARRLHRWEEQTYEHADDRNDNQQFDEGKRSAAIRITGR